MKSTEFTENKGTYAAVRFSDDTLQNIKEFIDNNDIKNGLDTKDIHATLLYSRNHLPDYVPKGDISYTASPSNFEVWESPANAFKDEITHCLVLLLDCDELKDRFSELMDEHDATYDFDEYKPHITLSYDVGKDFDITTLNVSDIKDLQIVTEYSEELNLDKTFD